MRATIKNLAGAVGVAVLGAAVVLCLPYEKHALAATGAGAESSAIAGSKYVPLFNGNGLQGWHEKGSSKWQAENGEVVGTAQNSEGGWLIANDGYQDFVLHVSFECNKCDGGVLIRGGKSGEKLEGIYIPLGGPQMGRLYRVTLNGDDEQIGDLKPMPTPPAPAAFQGGIAEGSCAPVSCDGIRNAHGGSEGHPNAAPPKPPQVHAGWNDLAITIRGDVIVAGLNGAALAPAQMDDGPQFGQIALHVGPAEAMRFKNVAIKDLTLRGAGVAKPYTDAGFRRDQLNSFFYSEGITAGDLNHNGAIDIVSGPFIYEGPNYDTARELYPPETVNVGGPQDGYIEKDAAGVPQAGAIVHGNYTGTFLSWTSDFDRSGWPDVIDVMGFGPRPTFSAHLFVNPKGEKRDWTNYEIYPIISNEYDFFLPKGIDGSGTPEMVIATATNPDWSDSRIGYIKPGSDVTKPWTFVPVSEPNRWGGHGMGVGDILGNGRLDILTSDGWWEQPAAGTAGLWKFHPQRFAATEATALVAGASASCFACGGSKMEVYDVNGDGLPDVITSLNAHGPGLGWFEQQRDAQGNITWKTHVIMGDPTTSKADRAGWEETDKSVSFTELHALDFADMNGDGKLDIVTGKRYWSHGFRYEENDVDDPPVVYWFELKQMADHKVEWMPHLIDNSSGVGTSMEVRDVNGDGRPDVLTTSRMGSFVFINNLPKK